MNLAVALTDQMPCSFHKIIGYLVFREKIGCKERVRRREVRLCSREVEINVQRPNERRNGV